MKSRTWNQQIKWLKKRYFNLNIQPISFTLCCILFYFFQNSDLTEQLKLLWAEKTIVQQVECTGNCKNSTVQQSVSYQESLKYTNSPEVYSRISI